MNETLPKLPDLTRESRCLVRFENDTEIAKILKPYGVRIHLASKKLGHNSDDTINKIFKGRYSVEDIKYRSEILEQLIENPKISNFWNSSISRMHLYRPNWLNEFDEDSYAEHYFENEELVKRSMPNLRWFNIPKTIDSLIELPKNTQGFIDVARFAKECKDTLGGFYEVIAKYVKDPFLVKKDDEWVVNVNKNNQFCEDIEPFRSSVKNFISMKYPMAYYKAMSVPFKTPLDDGTIVPCCKPSIVDKELRKAEFIDAYNPQYFDVKWHYGGKYELLALNVPNTFLFDDNNRMTFVLGPNNRGKSVYIRTIGLNMQLAMNGSYVFAKKATFSPIDDIFTCYDLGDSLGAGHFHTGAKKLQNMRDNVTPYTVVLVDETGGGTEPEAEAWIAEGVAKALIDNDITSFYITHEKGIWNDYLGQENINFLQTSDLDDDNRLYKIFPGIIQSGYGKQIVIKLGIDPKTMNETIRNRFENYKR